MTNKNKRKRKAAIKRLEAMTPQEIMRQLRLVMPRTPRPNYFEMVVQHLHERVRAAQRCRPREAWLTEAQGLLFEIYSRGFSKRPSTEMVGGRAQELPERSVFTRAPWDNNFKDV